MKNLISIFAKILLVLILAGILIWLGLLFSQIMASTFGKLLFFKVLSYLVVGAIGGAGYAFTKKIIDAF